MLQQKPNGKIFSIMYLGTLKYIIRYQWKVYKIKYKNQYK